MNELYENGLLKVISDLSTATPKGAHGFIQVLGDEKVNYMIASYQIWKHRRNDYQVIPKSTWAIFELTVQLIQLSKLLGKEFLLNGFQLPTIKYAEAIDIECFPYEGFKGAEDYKFEIWIPVLRIQD